MLNRSIFFSEPFVRKGAKYDNFQLRVNQNTSPPIIAAQLNIQTVLQCHNVKSLKSLIIKGLNTSLNNQKIIDMKPQLLLGHQMLPG